MTFNRSDLQRGLQLWTSFSNSQVISRFNELKFDDSQSKSDAQQNDQLNEVIAHEIERNCSGDSFDKIEAEQWITLLGSQDESSFLDILNDRLKSRMFVMSNRMISVLDFLALPRAYAALAANTSGSAAAAEYTRYPRVVRWFDYLQHNQKVKDAMTALNMPILSALPSKIDPSFEEAKAEQKTIQTEDAKQTQASVTAPGAIASTDTAVNAGAKSKKQSNKEKAKKQKGDNSNQGKKTPEPIAITPAMVDFRVGFIKKAEKHPDADSLYVSTVECGEDKPRTVVSGLVKYVPIEDMQERYVVLIANLKPANMRGIKSEAMVLCASNNDKTKVEIVPPPPGAKAGDRIVVDGFEDQEPLPELNPKKKIWEKIQPGLASTAQKIVGWNDENQKFRPLKLKSTGDTFLAPTLANASLS